MKINPNLQRLKQLRNELIIIGLIVILVIVAFIGYYRKQSNLKVIEELKRKSYAADTRHAMEIDSLKFKLLQDSLDIVDLQRVHTINHINQQDDKDKGNRDIVIAIIPNATDEQRDRIWAAYSPKN